MKNHMLKRSLALLLSLMMLLSCTYAVAAAPAEQPETTAPITEEAPAVAEGASDEIAPAGYDVPDEEEPADNSNELPEEEKETSDNGGELPEAEKEASGSPEINEVKEEPAGSTDVNEAKGDSADGSDVNGAENGSGSGVPGEETNGGNNDPGIAPADEITDWDGLKKAFENAPSGATIKLTRNITARPDNTALLVSGTVTLDLNGCTLDRHRNTPIMHGSAILVTEHGNLTIEDSSEDKTGTITGGYCEIGGGIWNEGTLTINGGTITGNRATNSNLAGAGAGIYNSGTLTMRGGTISNNTANWGGGIYNSETANMTLSGVTITGNHVYPNAGGGICNYGKATLSGCTVSGNTAGNSTTNCFGGGIYNTGSTLSLSDSTIENNTSTYQGGGIYALNGTVLINGCTVTGNSSPDGGGICIHEDAAVSCSGTTSIKDNKAVTYGGAGVTSYGTLRTEGSLTVTGNTAENNGGGLWINGTFEAQGTLVVKDNTGGGKDNNLYLKDGKVIRLTGALSSDSEIHLSCEKPIRPMTSGWASHQQAPDDLRILSFDTGMVPQRIQNEVFPLIMYMNRFWNGSSVVSEEITLNEPPIALVGDKTDGWFVVQENMTLSGRLTVLADEELNLILMDGVTLTCSKGVHVASGGILNIYGQKSDTGSLVADADKNYAGIGGNNESGHGIINIYGGNIKATGGEYGAGIGTGNNPGSASCEMISIYGGKVVAQGGYDAAGIGGGNQSKGAEICIYGGTVEATGGDYGTGIGGGNDKAARNVLIQGGIITAQGGKRAAGIGCGEGSAAVGTIWITGGQVTAKALIDSAGIGGGRNKSITSGTVKITGGTVEAYGERGAGIGSGYGSNANMDITISGGHVIAKCVSEKMQGAGIGGGAYNWGGGDFSGTVKITGGTVEAYGGGYKLETRNGYAGTAGIGGSSGGDMTGTVIISGGSVTAEGKYGGAAIGAGSRDQNNGGACSGTIRITGGNLFLKIHNPDSDLDQANVIGGSGSIESSPENGTLNLADGMQVSVDGTVVPADERVSTLHSRTNEKLVSVIPCPHANKTYTVTNDTHTLNCPDCLVRTTSDHTFDDDAKCTVCGYQGTMCTVSFEKGDENAQGEMEAAAFVPNSKVQLPDCYFIAPEGKRFLYWSVAMGSAAPVHKSEDEIITVKEDTVVTAVWEKKPVITIKGVSGSFNDRIKLNFYFEFPIDMLIIDGGDYVTITNDSTGKTVTLPVYEAEYDGDTGLSKFSIPLVAKEAGDTITAKVYDGKDNPLPILGDTSKDDYTESGVKYSLIRYFDWLKTDGTESEKAVGATAKDYCLSAMDYFGCNTTGLSVSSAVSDISEEQLNDLKSYIAGRTGDLPTGVSIKGISCMLESDNTVRLYLNFKDVDPGDFTFTIDGNPAELHMRSDGMYYLAMDTGVFSNRLQVAHEYTISDSEKTCKLTISALTYARSCAIKSDEKVTNLGKALYLYNRAAVKAFGE